MDFPEHVKTVMQQLAREGDRDRIALMRKLTANVEHEAMWRSLARRHTPRIDLAVPEEATPTQRRALRRYRTPPKHRSPPEDDWVWAFLEAVEKASSLPAYFHLSNGARSDLGDKIRSLTTELKVLYEEAGLSLHLVRLEGERMRKDTFTGLHVVESMGWEEQARIVERNIPQISVHAALHKAATAAQQKFDEAGNVGKAGKNVCAIRFSRALAERNRSKYGTPLLEVIATVTNTLYGTHYRQTDVRRLVDRRRLGNVD